MKRILGALTVAAALLIAVGGAQAQQKNFSIVTGGTGGVYYPLGGALANMLGKYNPGWSATAEVTGGSVDNLKLIGAKRADIAFTQVDASYDAVKGQDKFKGAPVKHLALAVLYPNIMHVVTVEGKGINTVMDLKGKRVSTGSPGSATEVFAFRIIEAAGLDKDKDMTRERLGAAESTNAIKDGKIDAYFFVAGVPTSAITDLGATPGTTLKLIDHSSFVPKMNEKYGPLYSPGVIKKGSYPGQDKDNQVATVWNAMVVADTMPDDVAYKITKTVFDHLDEWATVHKEALNVKLENQKQANSAVPFHPGALKFFAEKGIKVN